MDAPEGAEADGVNVVHGSDGTVALKAVAAREADVKTVAYFMMYCVFENVLFCSLDVLFLEIKTSFYKLVRSPYILFRWPRGNRSIAPSWACSTGLIAMKR